MLKNSKLKFSEYMQNVSRSKSVGKFVLIVAKSLLSLYVHILSFMTIHETTLKMLILCPQLHVTYLYMHARTL